MSAISLVYSISLHPPLGRAQQAWCSRRRSIRIGTNKGTELGSRYECGSMHKWKKHLDLLCCGDTEAWHVRHRHRHPPALADVTALCCRLLYEYRSRTRSYTRTRNAAERCFTSEPKTEIARVASDASDECICRSPPIDPVGSDRFVLTGPL
jgi:hypothetical protein